MRRFRPAGYEWDEVKRRRTLAERDLDFGSIVQVFDGRPVVHVASPRMGEDRVRSTFVDQGRLFTFVWLLVGDRRVRVISLRRAHVREERAYRQLFG